MFHIWHTGSKKVKHFTFKTTQIETSVKLTTYVSLKTKRCSLFAITHLWINLAKLIDQFHR